jgi:regulator of sigma E protease
MITLLVFLGTILVLVGTHEGGHFLASKLAGVYVKEFALGFGPKLLSFKKGETVYSIRAIPFGGYVRLAGEDGSEAPAGVPADRLLYNRPPLARFLTSLAGPAANLLMTLVVALVALWSIGTPILQVRPPPPSGRGTASSPSLGAQCRTGRTSLGSSRPRPAARLSSGSAGKERWKP